MPEQSEWDRYPSGRSTTKEEAKKDGVRRARSIALALGRPFEALKFEMVKIGTHVFWRITPK